MNESESIDRLVWIPIENLGDDELKCVGCGKTTFVAGDEMAHSDDGFRCEDCAFERYPDLMDEAEEFAKENCKITLKFPKYNPRLEYRLTPEEYREGARGGYTRNSHVCQCRHNCTNYEELIAELAKNSTDDGIKYRAIRRRIDELVAEQIEKDGDVTSEEAISPPSADLNEAGG